MTDEEIKKEFKAKFERTAATLGRGFIASRTHLRNHIKRFSRIAEILQVSKGDNVLEVGVGSGIHAEWISSKYGVNFFGLDVAVNMLKGAEKRLESVKRINRNFVAADASALPFASNAFDGAYSVGTIHYILSPDKMVKEMARVVKPGKKIAIIAPNYLYPMVFLAYHFRRHHNYLPKILEQKLRIWGRNAGLIDVKVERMLFTPPHPEQLLPIFDAIDRFVLRRNTLSRFSMNLLLSGRKV